MLQNALSWEAANFGAVSRNMAALFVSLSMNGRRESGV